MQRTLAAVIRPVLLIGFFGFSFNAQTMNNPEVHPRTTPTDLKDYPVKPVPFTAVHLNDGFWAPRIETNRTVTIPFAFKQCEINGRMYNFDRAAEALRGEKVTDTKPSEFPFDDTDVYKVIEGASYAMAVQPDPKMDAYVDVLIEKIKAAQEPDGYLYTARTMSPDHAHKWAGKERWVNEGELSHELYDLGHLYEAAVAHYQATGKRSLLDIALKTADLLDRTFGPGKRGIWSGHQIAEMGLVKLYRVTGEEKYLKLAKFLLDERGRFEQKGGPSEYNQSQKPVVEQTEAVGHAVRAVYMYSGMADVAALTGDKDYLNAIDTIWDNVVGKKLYITGGIGATASGEAFGKNYELPNMTAYNETCAAIGNDYWNQRLFLLHADAKYIDVFERTLYNGLISGISLDGKGFFYPNPLESKGQHSRSPWFGCACCPSNICRFMASIPGYVYAQHADAVYVNLFAGGRGKIDLDDGQSVELVQETNYPWDGAVKMTVNPKEPGAFALNVRIPGWSQNEAVPSDLYTFRDDMKEPVSLKVNGESVAIKIEKGYAALRRDWKAGDVIELNLPMPIRRVLTNDKVDADRGRVAIQRGPIVYCAEWPDSANKKVRNLLLKNDTPLKAEKRTDPLGGITVITGKATAYTQDKEGKLIGAEQDLTMIPYYAWAHRGKGEMSVWLANSEESVRPEMPATIASTSKIKTSPGGQGPGNINDGVVPKSSSDESTGFFHWWPKKGTTEWVEYTFANPESISESSVYWFDDTGKGECRVPKTWRLFYKDTAAGATGEWRPFTPAAELSTYGTKKDGYNTIAFTPVTTIAVRLEVDLQPNWSTGIQEWKVK